MKDSLMRPHIGMARCGIAGYPHRFPSSFPGRLENF